MSGSSLDGLDIAYCLFSFTDRWSFKLLQSKSVSLGAWENTLKSASSLSEDELCKLSVQFASYLSNEVKSFIHEYDLKKVNAVVSHGHTVYHYPEHRRTCQIGDGQTLANLLGLKVINNLRQADMNLGGQGAPIVPIGDLYLFPNYTFCLNLGGIANISIKSKLGIQAFDICMANQILNHFAQLLDLPYDNQGKLAKKGTVNQSLLKLLNSLSYYQDMGPKSLDNGMSKNIIAIIEHEGDKLENNLATYVEHIAIQIERAVRYKVRELDLDINSDKQLLITGGGAFNTYLLSRIQANLDLKLIIPSDDVIAFKEAIIMAFIGVLKLRKEVNVLASVTGASQDTSCGEIFEKA
jgi:anhydro-N-acetylmuramic acid kinase